VIVSQNYNKEQVATLPQVGDHTAKALKAVKDVRIGGNHKAKTTTSLRRHSLSQAEFR
jgi:hypothetical protein